MKTAQIHRVVIQSNEKRLQKELENLKRKLGLGQELTVKWLPNGNTKLCGEVKENCIYIYAETEEEAIKTLRHEFFDYVISQVLQPYQQIANKLIQFINEEVYKRKEKLAEALSRLYEGI